jgi:hypothetical protein
VALDDSIDELDHARDHVVGPILREHPAHPDREVAQPRRGF